MKLSQLLSALPHITARTGEGDPDITVIHDDSRRVQPGTLFVATRGANVDGHRFIPEAAAKGAAAIVCETLPGALAPQLPCLIVPNSREALGWLAAAWHGFPSRKLVLIGVTGTDGKTTTATLINSILRAAGIKAGLISTVNAVIGDETLDTGFHVTTPEALEIQGYLARMVAAGLTHAVLETTSHGLTQHRVTGCEYDIAVVTNITHEHLDEHGSYENYRAAKGRLFEMLSTAARKPGVEKTGVLNADDSSFEYLSGVLKEKRLSYSVRQIADIVARAIEYKPDATRFSISISNLQFSTSLIGAFNVSNCLAAIAATVGALGIAPQSSERETLRVSPAQASLAPAPEAAQRGIAELRGVPGRMERIDLGQPFTALVDFAHTPNALRRALETARQMLTHGDAPPARLYKPRVIAVFGSAGLRDVEKRRLMAETSAELADITVLTAEDPRTESLDDILEMMAFGARTKGGVEGMSFFRVPDRGEAIRLAVNLAQPGDIVLACGKGHEQSMCFGVTEYAWDDRVALRAALAETLSMPGPEMPKLPTSPG